MDKLYIVMPAYNEEENITGVVVRTIGGADKKLDFEGLWKGARNVFKRTTRKSVGFVW